MSRALVRSAALIALLAFALAVPALARATDTTPRGPATAPCADASCQQAQDPSLAGVGGVTTTVGPQRENENQADYALYGLLVVLLFSIPVVVTWQRNVRERAAVRPTRS